MLRHFSSDGVDIAFIDVAAEGRDRGEPILLIHGFASNHRINWVNPRWVETLSHAGRRGAPRARPGPPRRPTRPVPAPPPREPPARAPPAPPVHVCVRPAG